MQTVDLHVHSTHSDGTYSPARLVDYAMEKNLKAFALTDHDAVSGIEEAMEYAKRLRQGENSSSASRVPEVIPGVELSTEYKGHDVHIVGLYIDYQNSAFLEQLHEFVDSRTIRNKKMCRLLQDAGIEVTYEALLEEFPDAVITRAHYAKYMLQHGYITDMREAFERYIGDDCPCYIPREKVTPVQAVQLIRTAGGIAVLAHPILYHLSDGELDTLTGALKEAGLTGIEAVYSTYNDAEERKIRALAKKYDLLISGGSDFHGENKPGLDLAIGYGHLFVPESVLLELKQAVANCGKAILALQTTEH